MSGFGHVQLSPHFQLREFRCPCCLAFRGDEKLLAVLEEIRGPHALHIISGYRCTRHNEAVGGFANSNHTHGLAADITAAWFRGILAGAAADFGKIVEDFVGTDHGNVIYYPNRGFIHVDVGHRNWPTLVRAKEGA